MRGTELPVLARKITDVDTTRDHEWVYLDVIGLHPAVEAKAFAQSAVAHFQEMEENGIPLGSVRHIEVDESRPRW